ncbi:MAG: low molecular weight phosphotyrosine protein phosphatase [Bacteriovoracaceae bacterium]|nr:low molecular weight phosphotyrosine protein phosphatase [Bacteriovoracaceae bacterium]
MTKILFVCLGNICRSPAAEGVFLALLERENIKYKFEIDSAGTSGYHAGEAADERMIESAKRRGIHLPSRSRQLIKEDFDHFDYVVVMDDSNLKNSEKLAPQEHHHKIIKITDYSSDKFGPDHVPDPYYGGTQGFELVLDLLEDCCHNLLNSIKTKI